MTNILKLYRKEVWSELKFSKNLSSKKEGKKEGWKN